MNYILLVLSKGHNKYCYAILTFDVLSVEHPATYFYQILLTSLLLLLYIKHYLQIPIVFSLLMNVQLNKKEVFVLWSPTLGL